MSTAPELEPGRYALALVAFDPAGTGQFVRHGAATYLTPPTVGAFRPTTKLAIALAGMLSSWLDIYGRPVALAPPLLHIGGRWRVADLGLEWPLARGDDGCVTSHSVVWERGGRNVVPATAALVLVGLLRVRQQRRRHMWPVR